MEHLFPEVVNFFPGFVPVNMATGANNSLDRIDMSRYQQCAITVFKDKGAGAEPVVITVSQHNAKSGGTTKALNIQHSVYTKGHADLEGIATWTKTTSGVVGEVYTGTTLIQLESFIMIPVLAEDLDTANGYRWMSAAIASVGAQAQLGGMFYIMAGSRWTPVQDAMIP